MQNLYRVYRALVLYFSCMLHACYLLFILCLCMSVKSSTELMLYVVLTMPTLNQTYCGRSVTVVFSGFSGFFHQ
jgi:hypothetical protein